MWKVEANAFDTRTKAAAAAAAADTSAYTQRAFPLYLTQSVAIVGALALLCEYAHNTASHNTKHAWHAAALHCHAATKQCSISSCMCLCVCVCGAPHKQPLNSSVLKKQQLFLLVHRWAT